MKDKLISCFTAVTVILLLLGVIYSDRVKSACVEFQRQNAEDTLDMIGMDAVCARTDIRKGAVIQRSDLVMRHWGCGPLSEDKGRIMIRSKAVGRTALVDIAASDFVQQEWLSH